MAVYLFSPRPLLALLPLALALSPPPPPPSPPSSFPPYAVDGQALGHRFDGVGAQSTAGTARLLHDYAEPARGAVLDWLFAPGRGAQLHHLKVEIGGDAQISCGAEPAHQRTAAGAPNFARGYEFWLMREAKGRNPDLQLQGLVYAWPGFIGNATTPAPQWPFTDAAANARAAAYVTAWVAGARAAHNLSIDFVGIWNERLYTKDYVLALRRALDAGNGTAHVRIVANDMQWEPLAQDLLTDGTLRAAVDAVGAHYTGGRTDAAVQAVLRQYGLPLWSSEDYSMYSDTPNAGALAALLNRNYVTGNLTLTSLWHMVSAFYPSLPFWGRSLIWAHQPWSGDFAVLPQLGAVAHTTAFARPGMVYLQPGAGSGLLAAGGSYVAWVDPNATAGQLTMVLEKRSLDPNFANSSAETAVFHLLGARLASVTRLGVWRTCLGFGGADPATSILARQNDVAVDPQTRTISLLVELDCIYTLSSSTPELPAFPSANSRVAPFPVPFMATFEDCPVASQPQMFTDMSGAFECQRLPGNNTVLQQAAASLPASGTQECSSPSMGDVLPVTIVGDVLWETGTLAVDVYLPRQLPASQALVGLRVSAAATFAYLTRPSGLWLACQASGEWRLGTTMTDAAGLTPGALLASGHFELPHSPDTPVPVTLTVDASANTVSASIGHQPVAHQVPCPRLSTNGLSLTAGFAALAATFDPVAFDNVALSNMSSRCQAPLAAGQPAVAVSCGTAAASAAWNMTGGSRGAFGLVQALPTRTTTAAPADPLCLAAQPARPSNTTVGQPTRFDARRGPLIQVDAENITATWPASACNQVALMTAPGSTPPRSFWVQVAVAPASPFVDVGFCLPTIPTNITGPTHWMGWQPGQAWVYRASGLYKTASPPPDQGRPYGVPFGAGNNITAILHSATELEFLVDGVSQGAVMLPAPGVPASAVGCVGVCSAVQLATRARPAPPPAVARLAVCNASDPDQYWAFDAGQSRVRHRRSGQCLGLFGPHGTGFAPATLVNCSQPSAPALVWTAPPVQAIRRDTPMDLQQPGGTTNVCIGVCGQG